MGGYAIIIVQWMKTKVCQPEPVEGGFILAYRLRQAQPDRL